MMIGTTLALSLMSYLQVTFEPAFVFPGERFTFHLGNQTQGSEVFFRFTGLENVKVWQEDGQILGVVKSSAPARFWIWIAENHSLLDGMEVQVPVALCSAPFAPPVHSSHGPWIVDRERRQVALVPLQENYGLWILTEHKNLRLAPLSGCFIGARHGPVRERKIHWEYLYAGKNHITLLADVAGVARLAIVIQPARVLATLTALYDVRGEWWLLGRKYEIRLSSAETFKAEVELP